MTTFKRCAGCDAFFPTTETSCPACTLAAWAAALPSWPRLKLAWALLRGRLDTAVHTPQSDTLKGDFAP